MKLLKQCKTCEFNFSGTCAGHGDTYKYGEKITDNTLGCDEWGADLDYFIELTTNAPWYIKELYNDLKIDYSRFLELIEADIAGQPIKVNIYDAIRKVYGLSLVDLAVILNVSFGVMYRARSVGTPSKRLINFSRTLCIPASLFQAITTHDFDDLEECKIAFEKQIDVTTTLRSIPNWKQTLIQDVVNYFHCPIQIAKEIARVDKLKWQKGSNDHLNSSEKMLVDFSNKYGLKSKKSLGSLEYSLDIACRPHVHMIFYSENEGANNL